MRKKGINPKADLLLCYWRHEHLQLQGPRYRVGHDRIYPFLHMTKNRIHLEVNFEENFEAIITGKEEWLTV